MTNNRFIFIMTVYLDFEDAEQSLHGLLKHYPESTIIVIFDGTHDQNIQDICDIHNIKTTRGDHLWGNVAWIERWMTTGLNESTSDNDWIVKYDTEVHINNRLKRIPECDVFGCSRANRIGFKSWDIQGGMQFIRSSVVNEIIKNKLLDNPIYKKDVSFYSRLLKTQSNSLVFDHVVKSLDVFFVDHPELFFCVKYPRGIDKSKYSMIHPRKEKKLRRKESINNSTTILSTQSITNK